MQRSVDIWFVFLWSCGLFLLFDVPQGLAKPFRKGRLNARLRQQQSRKEANRKRNRGEKRKQAKRDLELAETASFLRNVLAGENVPGLEVLLGELCGRRGLLTPAFAVLLQHVRQNRLPQALEEFAARAGNKDGRELGRILLVWDQLEGKELSEMLLSYQKHLAEARYTAQRQEDELLSDVLYLPVVMNVVLIFLNFIYVGYFMQQQEMFRIFF